MSYYFMSVLNIKYSFLSKKPLWVALFAILTFISSFSFLAYKATRDPSIHFLSSDFRADWIMYPITPNSQMRAGPYLNLTTEYTHTFTIDKLSVATSIHVRAFKQFKLFINGKFVFQSAIGSNWKDISSCDITPYIAIGLNTIKVIVTSNYGPPALWLFTDSLQKNLTTNSDWFASINHIPPIPAILADDTRLNYISYKFSDPFHTLIDKLPVLGLFFVFCFTLFCFLHYRPKITIAARMPVLSYVSFTPRTVMFIAILLWAILFINNFSHIPVKMGFDAGTHLEYLDYIINKKAIPLANQFWEAYQPPLFYLASAIILFLAKLFLNDATAQYSLKLLPFISGLGQIIIAYYASRLFFPDNKLRQSIIVIFASIIPMTLYTSHYFSNEPLSAFFISLSLLVTFLLLKTPFPSLKQYFLLGFCISLALLSKFTIVTILPAIFLILLYHAFTVNTLRPLQILTRFSLCLSLIIALAGWFYLRNLKNFGNPLIGNWDYSLGFHWWQDPGFHTSTFFTSFGDVFSLPCFAGFYSLFDSLYSTFWGDSFLGGRIHYTFRPPWNYSYMPVIYILSIPAAILLFIGFIRAAVQAIRYADKFWILNLASIFSIFFSLVYMNLKIATYAQAKAFYGLASVLPITLIFVYGFDLCDRFLETRGRFIIRGLLFSWLATLVLSVLLSFFITPSLKRHQDSLEAVMSMTKPATEFLVAGNYAKAFAVISKALQTQPDYERIHYIYAITLDATGQTEKAIKHLQRAIEINPNDSTIHTSLAQILLREQKFEQGIAHLNQALMINPFNVDASKILHAIRNTSIKSFGHEFPMQQSN